MVLCRMLTLFACSSSFVSLPTVFVLLSSMSMHAGMVMLENFKLCRSPKTQGRGLNTYYMQRLLCAEHHCDHDIMQMLEIALHARPAPHLLYNLLSSTLLRWLATAAAISGTSASFAPHPI